MPELPEVESVKLGLEPLIGQKVKTSWRSDYKIFDKESLVLSLLEGQTLRSTERIGKYLKLNFDRHHALLHLGMSGVLLYNQEKRPHTHVELFFEEGDTLFYADPRRFGYWTIRDLDDDSFRWTTLGPDAVSRSFTAKSLLQKLASSQRQIKVLLLDQKIVAGIGNIYASEILFAAKVSPFRKGVSISNDEADLIVKHSKRILKASIKNRGTTFSNYRLTNGKDGAFQGFLKVFQKEGQECVECHNPLQKMTQAQRSTFYCAVCQL